MLRLFRGAAQDMDTGRVALAHLLLADQHLVGVVGRDQRRGDRRGEHHAHQDHADDAGLAAEQAGERGLPKRRRAAEQRLLVHLLGERLRAALQRRDHHSSLMRGSRKP